MSGTTHTDRSRQWLTEQLQQLGTLANAGPRDATFKAWRQHTLTVVQRIWPYDATRQDRFRRIRFTSPEPKADTKKLMEWFASASDQAATLLRQWIDEIEQHGVPEPPKQAGGAPAASALGDDVPTLDLADAPRTGPSSGIAARDEIMLDLGGPATTPRARAERPAEAGPAPPTLHVKIPDKLAALRKTAAPTPKSTVSPKPVAPEKPTLASAPPGSAPAAKSEPAAKPATEAPASRSLAKHTAKEPAPSATTRQVPAPESAPKPSAAATPAPPSAATTPKPALGELLGLGKLEASFDDDPTLAKATEAAQSVAAESSDDGPDPAAFEAAARDFMFSSPVLSAQGRPVQRAPEAPDFEHPDSLAISTLAIEAVKLGVPEGQRATARALLVDLARCLEDGDPSWETLRDAINWSMNHPELARRLLPVLLPWLDRAA